MKERNLLVINNLTILILIIIRLTVFGWVLLTLGLFVLLPITILHVIATNKGFMNYSKLSDIDKFSLFISLYSFIIFILFQYEMDDSSGYIVVEGFIRRFFIGFNNSSHDYSNASFVFSIITGLIIIATDIYIIVRMRQVKQNGIIKTKK